MSLTQVIWHGLFVIKIGNRGREVSLSGEQNIFCTVESDRFFLLVNGQGLEKCSNQEYSNKRNRSVILTANRTDPSDVQSRGQN